VGADAAHPEGWLAHRGLYRTPEGGAHLRGDIQIPGPDAPEAAALTPTLRPGWLVCPKARKQSQTPADRRICRPPPLLVSRRLDFQTPSPASSGRPFKDASSIQDARSRPEPCRAGRCPSRDGRPQPLLLAVAGLQPPCHDARRAKCFGNPSATGAGGAEGEPSATRRRSVGSPRWRACTSRFTHARRAFLSVGPMTRGRVARTAPGSEEPSLPTACR